MRVTTENIVEILEQVIELLNVSDDDEKIELAVDILTLVIDYIGAQRIVDTLDDALGNALGHVSGYIGMLKGDMDASERAEMLAQTRGALDEVFSNIRALEGV
ncbi:MAG: hypothetical protein ACLFP8_08920 [Alphaproteobacteria bacterium]